MKIILGAGRSRVELEIWWGFFAFRIPKVGEGLYHKREGWVFDRWDVIKEGRPIA